MGKNTESGGSEPHGTLTSGFLASAAGEKADLVRMEMRIPVKLAEKQRDLVYSCEGVVQGSDLSAQDADAGQQVQGQPSNTQDSRFKASLATHYDTDSRQGSRAPDVTWVGGRYSQGFLVCWYLSGWSRAGCVQLSE